MSETEMERIARELKESFDRLAAAIRLFDKNAQKAARGVSDGR